tara:strand:- start:3239 stop:3985 length:747 start_codon:yes stop_codon:yes gene_type:complete
MRKLLSVFWDVDGTLAETELSGHRVAFNRAFQDFDLDWIWDKKQYLELLKVSGGLNRIIFYKKLINYDLSDDVCSKIQLRKRFHYKEILKTGKIVPRDGVLRLIEELGRNNIQQFIVTTSGRESLDPFLNTSLKSYQHFFSRIITYEDVKNHKPFPDAYELAVKLSKNSNSNCLAIEDSEIGVEAAISANINCLLTLTPLLHSSHNITDKANACVDSIGSKLYPSNLFYGKELNNYCVDLNYLTNIIN